MRGFLLFTLLFLLGVEKGITQTVYTQSRIYSNNVPVVAFAAVGGPAACTTAFIALRSNNVRCAAILSNNTYAVTLELCPPELVGATALSCVASACYALNPVQKTIVVLDNYISLATFRVVTTINITGLAKPKVFYAYQRDSTTVDLLVVDGSGNTVWRYVVTTASPMTTTSVSAPFTGTPIGILINSPTTFIVATNGSTQLFTFPISGGTATPFGPTFGNIRSISLDGFGNVHVYDATCGCIRVVNPSGVLVTSVTIPNEPIFVSHSRKKIFVVDATGITKFEDVPQISISSTPVTCATRNASVSVQVSGGDYPYNVMLFPDYLSQPLNAPGNLTFYVNAPSLQGYPITLLDEGQSRSTQIVAEYPPDPLYRGWTNATAHTGNMSYYWNFTSTAGISFFLMGATEVNINSNKYEWIEFWINIGEGGQRFTINLRLYKISIAPGDLPKNTWVQYKLHIPWLLLVTAWANPIPYFNGVTFTCDAPNACQNYIYFDSFTATPYTSTVPDRNVYVFDKCSGMTHSVVPFIYTPFTVTISAEEVSCNAASTTFMDLTNDGSLTANLVNGVGPYTYNWSYPNSTSIFTSDINTTISGLPSQNSYISVYENLLNSSWRDTSTALSYNLSDTRYSRSPPYSIAFTPIVTQEAIIFSLKEPVSSIDFPTVEFWINGGPTGGQTLAAWVYQSATDRGIVSSGGPSYNNPTTNYPTVPKNTWIKVTIEVPPTAGKYNVITIVNLTPNSYLSNLNFPTIFTGAQDTVWIDDLVLIGKNVINVIDSTGCVASTARARIDNPPAMVQSISVKNVKCYGGSDGSVSVQMTGGFSPYNFSWSNSNETSSIRSGLSEGNVTIGVRDAKQCQFKEYVATVLQPPEFQLATSITSPKCYNARGRLAVTVSGGSGTYTHYWSSPSSYPQVVLRPAPEPIFLDSPSDPFTLFNAQTVCGGSGATGHFPAHSGYCSMLLNFSASAPTTGIMGCGNCLSPTRYASVTFFLYADTLFALNNLAVVIVHGDTFNSSIVNVSSLGARPKFWNQVTVQLMPGTHPDGLMFISSAPKDMGAVIVDDIVSIPQVANGAGFSTYSGFISEIDVVASEYKLVVLDTYGCTISKTINITQPKELTAFASPTPPTTSTGTDGSIAVQATGGTEPYQYIWIGKSETSSTIQGISVGTYGLTVMDANGCTYNTSVIVDYYANGPSIRAYNSRVAGGLAAITGAGMLIALFAFIMLGLYWALFSSLGSFFSSVILLGCGFAFASALVLLPQPTDALCAAFPWLLGIGFILVYGCLFIKTWGLYQVWINAIQYNKVVVTPRYIMTVLGWALIIEVIFLIIWTGVEPPRARLVNVVDNYQEWQCDVEHPTFWVIFLVVKGIWLVLGVILSILTRDIAKKYSESTSIAYAIYNNVLLGTIAIPLVILLKETPGGRVAVEVVVITLAFSFTLVLMFFRVWRNILESYTVVRIDSQINARSISSSSSFQM